MGRAAAISPEEACDEAGERLADSGKVRENPDNPQYVRKYGNNKSSCSYKRR